MVYVSLNVALELRFVCLQCGQEMKIEGQQQLNPSPTLKCPACGFRIQVQQGTRVQIPRSPSQKFPQLRPKKF